MMTVQLGQPWRPWSRVAAIAAVVGLIAAGAPRAAEPTRPDRVVGRVVDADGRPVAGAEVVGAFDPPGEDDDEAPDAQPVARARADADGRFDLAWPGLANGRGEPTLWAWRDGYRLARARVGSPPVGDAAAAEVRLEPVVEPAAASVEVVGPDGKPLAGARVVPARWFEGNVAATSARTWEVPRVVGDLLARATGRDGRATLPGVAALRLAGVAVESPLGVQVAAWDQTTVARHRAINLVATGRVAGRVLGEGASGLAVHIASRDGAGRPVGRATTVTDGEGRFAVDGVAAGAVEVRVDPRPGGSELAGRVVGRELAAGGTLTVAVPLRRGVAVRGRVRLAGEPGTPVAGAWVVANGPGEVHAGRARADADGRFRILVPPGSVVLRVESTPGDALTPPWFAGPSRADVPAGAADFDWPDLRVDRGAIVRGRVLDDGGRPAGPGVIVEARWTLRDGRAHEERRATGPTADGGEFAVGPVPMGVAVVVAAHRPGDRTGHVDLSGVVDGAGPVVVRLPTPDARVAPSGRVVDATGRPVAGALVQFRVADPALIAHGPRSGRRVAAPGLDAVVTDELGRYVAAGRVDARHRYVAAAEAAGCESGRTRPVALHPGSDGVATFPDIVVDRHADPAVLVGRVVDGDGRPVSGAVVFDRAHHEAVADAEGWFHLERAGAEGPTFLFARHPDCRFAGRALDPRDGEVDRPLRLVLARRDGPAGDGRPGQPPAAAARGPLLASRVVIRSLLVEPFIGRIVAARDPLATTALLEHLARVDPGRAAAWLAAGVVADARVADGLRRVAARNAAAGGLAAAGPILAAIADPATRCRATLEAIAADPGLGIEARRARIGRVEADALALAGPEARAIALARVADAWALLGDRDRAARTVDEAVAVAATLPRATAGARAWCALIEPLARVDPGTARRRLEHLVDPADLDRCRLAIARQLAAVDPAGAVQAFRLVRDAAARRRATPELCYLLAPADPRLARALVDAIPPGRPLDAAHALGMLAAGLARVDPKLARASLDEAFDRLDRAAGASPGGTEAGAVEPAAVAAALLPVVASLDPRRAPEYAWRALAIRPARAVPDLRADALLAVLLDPYLPSAARALFDPTRAPHVALPPGDLPAVLLAAAQLAPELALRWVDPPGRPALAADADPLAAADPAHLALIAAWTETDRGRRDLVVHQHLDLWTPPEPATLP